MGELVYRSLGEPGQKSPRWLADLRTSSGVYVIRSSWWHEVLYVGSSAGRLTKTILRHVQAWKRAKGFWEGMFTDSEADPGRTYSRGSVQVAVVVCPVSRLAEKEQELILRLRPRDNQNNPAPEAVPF